MEKEDERTKHLCGWSKGSDSRHLEGEKTPRWVKNAATWELPRLTRWDYEKENKSHKISQFEKSNFTSNFNVSLQEPNNSIYSVEGRWYIKADEENEKAFEMSLQTKCVFSTTTHKSYSPIPTSLFIFYFKSTLKILQKEILIDAHFLMFVPCF